MNWPADRLERRPVEKLIPYARNSRTHSDEQVGQIAASIREWGWTVPILIEDNGGIIAGHGRVMAAQKLGIGEVPCVVAKGWTKAQKQAYVIADNKLPENAGWDNDLLKLELAELDEMGFDLDLTGFSIDELGSLMADPTEGLTDPDSVPEAPEHPVTVPGDVWLLGRHRLVCGDSTSADDVGKLCGAAKMDFCFTSPPYNAALKCDQMHSKAPKSGAGGLYVGGYGDARSSDDYIQFNQDIFSSLLMVASDNFTCCYNINYNKNSPSEYIDIVAQAKRSIPLVETIVWEKSMAVSLQGDNLTRIFEFVFVFAKGRFKINKNRTDCLKNLWKISNIGANHEKHKACFPLALVEEGVKSFCPHGGNIIEPFGGTGTVAIAAEKMGCTAFLMELDSRYCDVIVKRWQDFTGNEATLEATGATFAEIQADRMKAVA